MASMLLIAHHHTIGFFPTTTCHGRRAPHLYRWYPSRKWQSRSIPSSRRKHSHSVGCGTTRSERDSLFHRYRAEGCNAPEFYPQSHSAFYAGSCWESRNELVRPLCYNQILRGGLKELLCCGGHYRERSGLKQE